MKHGATFRKLSRSTSHRMLMLRNLVTSLFEHERIKTTLPKAREAARLAEKIITLGKKGSVVHMQRAGAFLLKPAMVPKLFNVFAPRYAERPGGYTRIHKFGNRFGDNAPAAILELVDNPHDLKYEMTSRAVGWELYGNSLRGKADSRVDIQDASAITQLVSKDVAPTKPLATTSPLRDYTRLNVMKALRYRSKEDVAEFGVRARDQVERLMASPEAHMGLQRVLEHEEMTPKKLAELKRKDTTRYHQAGERLPKMDPKDPTKSSVAISRGALWRPSYWSLKKAKLGIASES